MAVGSHRPSHPKRADLGAGRLQIRPGRVMSSVPRTTLDRSRRPLPRFHRRRLRPAHPWPATRSPLSGGSSPTCTRPRCSRSTLRCGPAQPGCSSPAAAPSPATQRPSCGELPAGRPTNRSTCSCRTTTAATGCASTATTRLHETVPIDSGATSVTTPDRTAFDLARWAPDLVERVLALDALAHCCKARPRRRPRAAAPAPRLAHGAVIAEALPRPIADAESPMETRVRCRWSSPACGPGCSILWSSTAAGTTSTWRIRSCGSRWSTTVRSTAPRLGPAATSCAKPR